VLLAVVAVAAVVRGVVVLVDQDGVELSEYSNIAAAVNVVDLVDLRDQRREHGHTLMINDSSA
jgi:hypothetical protein